MVKVPFRPPKSSRPDLRLTHRDRAAAVRLRWFAALPLQPTRPVSPHRRSRRLPHRADLLELAATDVEDSRAEEAATAIAALAANRRVPTGGSSEQQSKPSPPRQVLVPSWPAQHGAFVEQSGRKRRRSGASAAAAETA